VVGTGEHVFEKLGGGSDGSGGVQRVLHGRGTKVTPWICGAWRRPEKPEPALEALESRPTVIDVIYLRSGRKHVIHMPEHIEERRRHRRGARVG
jgi:hypothetical protein